MPAPVTLIPVTQPTQARATLSAEQVVAFQTLLAGSDLIALPEGKTTSDIHQFVVNVQPSGTGFLQIAVK